MKIGIGKPILRVHKLSRSEIAYLSAYAIYLVVHILRSSMLSRYFLGLRYYAVMLVCFALMFMGEFLSGKLTRQAFFSLTVAALLSIGILRSSVDVLVFLAAIFLILFARDKNYRRIIDLTLWIETTLVVLIVFLACSGMIDNHMIRDTLGRYRVFLGFRYALNAPAYVFNIVALLIYKKKDAISFFELAFLAAVNYWVYVKTGSRLSYYLSVLILVVGLIWKLSAGHPPCRKQWYSLLIPAYPACALFSIIASMIYDRGKAGFAALDYALGHRISLAHTSIVRYGISLLGNRNIEWIGNGLDSNGRQSVGVRNYVDNLYVRIMLRYGVLFLALVLAVLTATMVYYYRQQNYLLLIILSVLALHGIIDNMIMHLYYNTFWICILSDFSASYRIRKRSGSDKETEKAYMGRGSLL